MFEEEVLRHDNEEADAEAHEEVEVEEPLDEGEEGHEARAEVALHVAQLAVPQLHAGEGLTQGHPPLKGGHYNNN